MLWREQHGYADNYTDETFLQRLVGATRPWLQCCKRSSAYLDFLPVDAAEAISALIASTREQLDGGNKGDNRSTCESAELGSSLTNPLPPACLPAS